MPPKLAALLCSCLLFFPPSARADLEVTVFPSVIRGKPGSDVELPCTIVDTLRPINLKQLAVIWKIGSKVIAKYEDIFEAKRPGATMSVENLQKGNATLLLPDVQDSDAGLYMCEVIHQPNQGEGTVELKIEAAPSLTHGPTIVRLGVKSNVTCVASDFYPADIFVTWRKDGKIVKHRERATARPHSNGLFSAQSALELTPQIADVNSTISCKIDHKTIQQPLIEEFRLQVQAKPIVEVVTLPRKEKDFCAAECLVSGFYPETIHIDWLQNGAQEETFKSRPEIMSNGTFSIKVLVLPKTGDKNVLTCLVQHESLDAPLRKEVLWLPKGEEDSVTHRTTLSSQSPGKEQTTQSSCPTAVSLCPTDPPAPETCASFPPWLFGMIGVIVGLVIAYLATTFYYKKKAKHTPSPGGESKHLIARVNKDSEQDISESKAEQGGLHHTKVHPEQVDKDGHKNMSEVKTEEPPYVSDSAL